MRLQANTNLNQLIAAVPECGEFLYPFFSQINEQTTLDSLSREGESYNALQFGLARTIKRVEQNCCDYEQMRSVLVKPGAVNIAGFVNFLWQGAFVDALKLHAGKLNIDLNINIFPKHLKTQFQNYLSICTSADDLPDILVGKGFSSLMTSRFIDLFVKSGCFKNELSDVSMGAVFVSAGFADPDFTYHPFGIDEMVMVYDKTLGSQVELPTSWSDILTPQYRGTIMQMGKEQRDHFGFVMMLYLFAANGEEAIKQYAGNVKEKHHFAQIIKNIGTHHDEGAPINVLHQFASLLIRSDVKDKTEVITTKEGNPIICNFFLLKRDANTDAMAMATSFYSPQIRSIMEKGGTTHITSNAMVSKNEKIRWIGWDTIKTLPHPYIKEYLSEIAFNHYKNAES